MEISRVLLNWYQESHRDLPWRNTDDPYKIWLSEVILQQTRVEQGMPYWYRFVEAFPTATDLANADEQEVLRLWQGLGYYSRARNLHTAAKTIRDDFNGVFPNQYDDIRSLKGIGDYTAAAIASIAFNLPHAVVDGNVYRFLSRLFAIETPIDSTQGKKDFFELANGLLDKENPGMFNQAMMEFGATLCKPSAPKCTECPFASQCLALKNNSVVDLPVKTKKTKTRNRYFEFLIITDEENVLIERRSEKDIWQGLHQFPMVEKLNKSEMEWELMLNEVKKFTSDSAIFPHKKSEVVKHVLSHQILFAQFWWIKVNEFTNEKQPGLIRVPWSELNNYGMPQLIIKYLQEEDYL